MTPPRATYRVQLHAGFDFDDAAAIVPYLAGLGISHLYTSPVLQAEAGSTHGYDVVDHARLNAELGGAPAFDRLVATLRAKGMGLVIDLVPNHMAISPANRWWWDVLEHGPASLYARYFDVYWDAPASRSPNVILVPVLADDYRRVLRAGGLAVGRDRAAFVILHRTQRFPIDPRSLGPLLADAAARSGSDELAVIAHALGELPPSTSTRVEEVERRRRAAGVLAQRLEAACATREVAAAIDVAVRSINADHRALDALLQQQNYRLAFEGAVSHDLGYRRFFDINNLVGLRVELPEVFEATHRVILDRVEAGEIQGLRVDHPDGLRDPAAYFTRLRQAAPGAWIVAEKILERDEPLRDWPLAGTTGYRFANLATQLQVDAAAEGAITAIYAEATGADTNWREVAHRARLAVLAGSLGSDVDRLAGLWLSLCHADPRHRHVSRDQLNEALRVLAACYGVYRTYVRDEDGSVADADRMVVHRAVADAKDRRPDLDPGLFDLLATILLLEAPGGAANELAMRFQQLTPAAMAKGVEDTAFYRYLRLVALNEVGGDPGAFGLAPAEFHAALLADHQRWPEAMLTVSTHDTKRSADARARMALLAEAPEAWRSALARLARRAAPHRVGPDLPGPAAEHLLIQTLIGAWPLTLERCLAYMQKATREAKERTSWTSPDPTYHDAMTALVRGCLGDPGFVAELEVVVAPLVEPGRVNALAQLLWMLTAPGVPDLYQGSELWHLALVDPDNRRPVDFALRRRLLEELPSLAAAAIRARSDEGLPKLWLAWQALALRASRPDDLSPAGAYRPLAARGPAAEHVVAYARGEGVVAVAPRLVLRLEAEGGWRETTLPLPRGGWRNRLTGEDLPGEELPLGALLAEFPVALLERAA